MASFQTKTEIVVSHLTNTVASSTPSRDWEGYINIPDEEVVGSIPDEVVVCSIPDVVVVCSIPDEVVVGSIPDEVVVGSNKHKLLGHLSLSTLALLTLQ